LLPLERRQATLRAVDMSMLAAAIAFSAAPIVAVDATPLMLIILCLAIIDALPPFRRSGIGHFGFVTPLPPSHAIFSVATPPPRRRLRHAATDGCSLISPCHHAATPLITLFSPSFYQYYLCFHASPSRLPPPARFAAFFAISIDAAFSEASPPPAAADAAMPLPLMAYAYC